MLLLPMIFSFVFAFFEKDSPYKINILPARLRWIFLFVGVILFFFTIFKFSSYRNYHILSSFYYNSMVLFALILLGIFTFLFTCSLSNMMLDSYYPSIVYIVLLIFFSYYMNNKVNITIMKALYKSSGDYRNKFNEKWEIIQKYITRYGGIIATAMVLIKRFFFHSNNGSEEHGLIEQFAVFFSPLMLFLGFWVIIAMKEEVMQGYYLKKYCEEYRVKYGISIKDWYGMNSKQYLEEFRKNKK